MATVAIAGATGFVGTALLDELCAQHNVIALTRGRGKRLDTESLSWRTCDLFSMLETEQALQGVDFAIYLVHSMLPSAELTQGRFEDLDLLVADNFAKASARCGVKHIVYIGGIIPKQEELSRHLKSREEVEKSLRASGVPVTVLRAAMIFGAGSSSFQIMTRLIRRLPIMLCPRWTANKSTPVFIGDVVKAICHVVGNETCFNRVYDLGTKERISYVELMQTAARVLGKKARILTTDLFMFRFSAFWVSLVTGAPRNLVKPLIESLRHDMLVDEEALLEIPDFSYTSIEEGLRLSYKAEEEVVHEPRAFVLPPDERQLHLVRSVQRFTLPKGKHARDIGELYFSWLPFQLAPFLKVKVEGDVCYFNFPFISKSLLIIERSEVRSSKGRQLFYIRGGLLVRTTGRGRLEFRETYNNKEILAAIHDYDPALPWPIYKVTQALLHLWVMSSFHKYLKSM